MATIAKLLEVKQGDIEWDAWFTDKMSITHLALLEDHLLDYSRRSVDDQCKNCMLWHCEKLKGYSIYEAPKFFDGDHESTYQKVGELAQAVQDSLGNLAQSEALDYAKKVRDLRYELIGYGVYDFTVAQGQDRHFEELEAYNAEIILELEQDLSYPRPGEPKRRFVKLIHKAPWRETIDAVINLDDPAWGLLGYPKKLKVVVSKSEGATISSLAEYIKGKEAGMEQERHNYYCAIEEKHPHKEIVQIETLEQNPRCPYCGGIMTYGRYWGALPVAEQEGPKTIQQLLQEQTLLEQHQKDRPQDIIFFKDTIMKHYYPKEDFHPDSFRVVKPEPGVMVTLGCLKEHKWYPEKLECVPTQTLHRTIVPRTEKYIKEAEEWEAVGVPAQHRETEVGVVPRELVEVIKGSSTPITERSTVVCPGKNGLEPEKMSPEAIQDELNALLYDEAVRKACGAEDRELLSIIIAQPKAHHFDFLTGKTEWKVRGKWKKDEGFDIERNAQLDVEFKDAADECVGKRIINLLKAYNTKVVSEELLYARTMPIEEGTL